MSDEQILMITSSYDKTCDYLIDQYPNLKFFRLDLDRFSEYLITYTVKGFEIIYGNHSIDSKSCLSIYFRKPALENLDAIFDAKYHSYVHKETYSVIEGIVESFDGIVLSKPSVMRKANNKVYQASLVEKAGFIIPKMAITNSMTVLDEFTKRQGIIKPVAIGEITTDNTKEFVQTNKIDPLFKTDIFNYSPSYLQDYLEKDYEVRITIVDGNIFPVKIISENNIDWRKPNNNVSYEVYFVDENITRQCLLFMEMCGMKFGCFDFIVKDDIWYFLEMNANGQWAWLEFETGSKISQAIVDYLMSDRTRNKEI